VLRDGDNNDNDDTDDNDSNSDSYNKKVRRRIGVRTK
jgi:hypothetical protein